MKSIIVLYLDKHFSSLGLITKPFDVTELTDVFDIAKIYHHPVQQELDGNLVCPKIICQDFELIADDKPNASGSKKQIIKCPECDGNGYITIEKFVHKHNYEKTFECKLCSGTRRIDITNREEEFLDAGDFAELDIEYKGNCMKMNYWLAKIIFRLHGKPCKYGDNDIIINGRV